MKIHLLLRMLDSPRRFTQIRLERTLWSEPRSRSVSMVHNLSLLLPH